MRAAPGDPFANERGRDPEIQKNLKAKYHLDKPLWVQYGIFLKNLLQGDLGLSTKYKDRTVNEIVAGHLPPSVLLGVIALLLALVVGVATGTVAAVRQNTVFDYSTMAVAMVGISAPTFVVGPLLVLVFAYYLHWFPITGWGSWHELILPAVTLALPFTARISRLMRTGMLEIIRQEFIKTARAKGLTETRIVLRHAIRGALLPVISYLGPATAEIMTGSLVVEKIFQVPGIGYEFVNSALNRDYSLVLGLVAVFGTLLVFMNLLVDIVYGLLDPRIRYE
jgi:oligopeptide transport system permease protein